MFYYKKNRAVSYFWSIKMLYIATTQWRLKNSTNCYSYNPRVANKHLFANKKYLLTTTFPLTNWCPCRFGNTPILMYLHAGMWWISVYTISHLSSRLSEAMPRLFAILERLQLFDVRRSIIKLEIQKASFRHTHRVHDFVLLLIKQSSEAI